MHESTNPNDGPSAEYINADIPQRKMRGKQNLESNFDVTHNYVPIRDWVYFAFANLNAFPSVSAYSQPVSKSSLFFIISIFYFLTPYEPFGLWFLAPCRGNMELMFFVPIQTLGGWLSRYEVLRCLSKYVETNWRGNYRIEVFMI